MRLLRAVARDVIPSWAWLGGLVFCLWGGAACSVSQHDKSPESVGCTGPNCEDAGAMREQEAEPDPPLKFPVDAAAPNVTDGDTVVSQPELVYEGCLGECVPDDAESCEAPEPSTTSEDPQPMPFGVPSFQQTGTVPLDAGATGPGSPDASLSGEEGATDEDDAPEATPEPSQTPGIDAGSLLTVDAAAPLNVQSCQLLPVDPKRKKTTWEARCAPAGNGDTGAACTRSQDCAPGLACVGEAGVSQCRPYCCDAKTQCGQGQFCATRPLRSGEMTEQEPPLVPVCVVAERCDLTDPFPCEDDQSCDCPSGRSCTIVSEMGLTGCVVPSGDGIQDEPCPCDAGFVCSQGGQTCLQLCQIPEGKGEGEAAARSCGDNHRCVVNPTFPQGWGLCVLAEP